jgi:hypothetical protein
VSKATKRNGTGRLAPTDTVTVAGQWPADRTQLEVASVTASAADAAAASGCSRRRHPCPAGRSSQAPIDLWSPWFSAPWWIDPGATREGNDLRPFACAPAGRLHAGAEKGRESNPDLISVASRPVAGRHCVVCRESQERTREKRRRGLTGHGHAAAAHSGASRDQVAQRVKLTAGGPVGMAMSPAAGGQPRSRSHGLQAMASFGCRGWNRLGHPTGLHGHMGRLGICVGGMAG